MISVLLTSSVLILVILLLRKLLWGKVGNVFLYALWLVVAVRLLLPVPEFFLEKMAGLEKPRMGSSVSVMNLAVPLASHWENDTAGQGEEYSGKEDEKLAGEDSEDILPEKLETEGAEGQTSEEVMSQDTHTAQRDEGDETASLKPEMSENTEDLHMYEKMRGGGGGSLANFPQSPWPA